MRMTPANPVINQAIDEAANQVTGRDIPPEPPGLMTVTQQDPEFLGLPLYEMALIVIGVSMLLTMVRLIRGPTLADRVVALDLLSFFAAGAIAIIAVEAERPELLMVAVVVALLTFMSTAAFALYLERQGRESAAETEGGGIGESPAQRGNDAG